MSDRYWAMIAWAKDQVIPHLDGLGPPDLDRFKRLGWDGLTRPYKELMLGIFRDALEREQYELSYTQTCNALHQAFQTKGWVE